MKAKDLIKKSVTIHDVYKNIEEANGRGEFKFFYPHFVYVSNEVKMQLMSDGFKLSEGEFFVGNNGLIIEW